MRTFSKVRIVKVDHIVIFRYCLLKIHILIITLVHQRHYTSHRERTYAIVHHAAAGPMTGWDFTRFHRPRTGFIVMFSFTISDKYCYQTFSNIRNLEISHTYIRPQRFEPSICQLRINHQATTANLYTPKYYIIGQLKTAKLLLVEIHWNVISLSD